jgi:pimeloyl-ACP methyl ester carboxylesterase
MNSQFIANLHVQSGGEETGPTVLLLHGVTRQVADLQPIIHRLPKSFRWIAVDFPGHGKSPGSNSEYKVRDYSAAVVQFLESIAPQPFVIFGHSLGAMVAAQVASLLPKRIAGAILEDPPFSTMGSRIKESSFYLQFQGVRDLLYSRPEGEVLFQRLRELPVRRASDLEIVRFREVRDDASLRTYAKYLSEVDPRVLDPIVSTQWLDGYDLEAIAAKIDCPVLLIQADPKFGGMLTDFEANQFASRTANCHLRKFEAAGHLIHASHAEGLANEITAFLQLVAPAPS